MRVVCYINKLNDGGAERVMSVVANGLTQRGHQVSLVTDYSTPTEYPLDPAVKRTVLDGEFTGVTSKGSVKRTIRRIRTLRKICKTEKADIVISFMSNSNFRAILATRLLKTKNLISVRVDPKIGYKSPKQATAAKLLYPLAAGCVFQTKEAQAWFSDRVQRKSEVILNPISPAFLNVQGEPLAEKRIVTCGRLNIQKRFDLMIDAFDKICDNHPDFSLEIYGVGDKEADLKEQIQKLGRNAQIRLMGRCEDVPNAIKNAYAFVLSSDFEGLPNALMEAMALGLPVISTDCGGGGARALINDGEDGWIVPCGDADALSKAMDACMGDSEEAKRRGEKAGEKAKGFSAQCVVAQWETYLKKLVRR